MQSLSLFFTVLSRAHQTQLRLTSAINLLANHLIVIFAFSVPFLIDVRRTTLFLLIVIFLVRGRYIANIAKPLRDPVILAFTLYFTLYILWLTATDDWIYAKKVTHDAAFLLFPLLFATFIDQRYIQRILSALFLGMAISVIWGYGILLEVLPPHLHDGIHGTASYPSPVWNPNPWAFMLALTVAIWYAHISSIKNNPWFHWAGVAFSILAVVMLVILSKIVGWILLIVLCGYLAYRRFHQQMVYFLAIILIFLPLACATAYLASKNVRQKIGHTITETTQLLRDNRFDGSIGWRAAFWYYSRDALRESIWFGLGTGDDKEVVKHAIMVSDPILGPRAKKLDHVHNQYLSSILQFGFLGLIIFLNIIIQLLRYRDDNNESRLTLQLTGIAVAVYSLSDIFVIGLGHLLLVVTIVPLSLRNHFVQDIDFTPINIKQLSAYSATIVLFMAFSLLN